MSAIYLLPVIQMSDLSYVLGTVFMPDILFFKLCCTSLNLTQITLECKCHVMSLIWCWGQTEDAAWPSFEKNGGLSCFPHLVLRVHSSDNNIIVNQGEKSLASLRFRVDETSAWMVDVWAHCWLLMCTALHAGHKPPALLGYFIYFNEKREIRCTWVT